MEMVQEHTHQLPPADCKSAERLALDLLEKYDVLEPPVNVALIARGEGFKLYESDCEPNVAGLVEVDTKEIFVRRTDSYRRQRFTIAHELGHYLLGHANNKEEYDNILFRLSDNERSRHSYEIEANAFAANLLMPKAFLTSDIQRYASYTTTEDFAKAYGVSPIAMQIRRDFLGI